MKFSSSRQVFLNLGRESEEVTVVEEPMDEVAVSETEGLEEMQDLKEENDLVEDAIETTDSVDGLTVAVESTLATGRGLNRFEAAALNRAIRSCTRDFISEDTHLVPATESYEETEVPNNGDDAKKEGENNKETSKEAKKGLKETIKAFFKAIIEKAKGMWKKLLNIIKSFKDRSAQTITHLKALAAKMESLPEFTKVEVEMNTLNLHLGGKVAFENILTGVQAVDKILDGIYKTTRSGDEHNFLMSGLEALKGDKETDKWQKFKIASNAFTVTYYKSLTDGKSTSTDAGHESEELLGGRSLVLSKPDESGFNQLATISLERTKGQGELADKITVPSKRSLADLIDESLALAVKAQNIYQDKKAIDRVGTDIAHIEKVLDVNVIDESNFSSNKGDYISMMRLFRSGSQLRYWITDLSLIIASNVYQLASKATNTNIKGEKEAKK